MSTTLRLIGERKIHALMRIGRNWLDFRAGGKIIGNVAEREDFRWRLDAKNFGSV